MKSDRKKFEMKKKKKKKKKSGWLLEFCKITKLDINGKDNCELR